MFAFTPKSILESRISKIRSKFYVQIIDETHMNLQRAKIADLSRMQISSDAYGQKFLVPFEFLLLAYRLLAQLAMFKIGKRNFPNSPS